MARVNRLDQDDMKPRLIEGGLHVDTRGTVSYINGFDLEGVDRFYAIRSHRVNEPRGWVGHRREQKWFTAINGRVLVAVVKPDDWESPRSNLPVERFVLTAAKPQVLQVSAGHATGSLSLSEDAILMVFSSGRIEEAGADDYRFPLELWALEE